MKVAETIRENVVRQLKAWTDMSSVGEVSGVRADERMQLRLGSQLLLQMLVASDSGQ
jgi:hypothetical protein